MHSSAVTCMFSWGSLASRVMGGASLSTGTWLTSNIAIVSRSCDISYVTHRSYSKIPICFWLLQIIIKNWRWKRPGYKASEISDHGGVKITGNTFCLTRCCCIFHQGRGGNVCATGACIHQRGGTLSGREEGRGNLTPPPPPPTPVPLYMKPCTVENQKCSDSWKYLVLYGVWL